MRSAPRKRSRRQDMLKPIHVCPMRNMPLESHHDFKMEGRRQYILREQRISCSSKKPQMLDVLQRRRLIRNRSFHDLIKLPLIQKINFSYRVIVMYEIVRLHHRLTQSVVVVLSIQVHKAEQSYIKLLRKLFSWLRIKSEKCIESIQKLTKYKKRKLSAPLQILKYRFRTILKAVSL